MEGTTATVIGGRRRPVGVWIISIFYGVSIVWTLLSLALIYSGAIPLEEAQRNYFRSLTVFDWLLTAAGAVFGVAAIVSLFRLRRAAARLFMVTFGLNVVAGVWQLLRGNLVAAAPATPGLLPGILIGVTIQGLFLVYALRLEKKGVLA